jgi:hypothetical protein
MQTFMGGMIAHRPITSAQYTLQRFLSTSDDGNNT